MSRPLSRWAVLCLTLASFVAAGALAQDTDKAKEKKKAGRPDREVGASVATDGQRVAGVIVKAERAGKGATSRQQKADSGKGQSPMYQITVNPDVVWRDWVRDQVGISPNASPREAAERGANSVATKGEPQTAGSLIVIDVNPNTKVETRFRESDDETSKGSKTPAEAAAATEKAGSDKAKDDPAARGEKGAEASKGTQFQADDLKPGLYVEVDYRHQEAGNVASTLTVIRPIGLSDSPVPAKTDEPKAKAKARSKAKAGSKSDR